MATPAPKSPTVPVDDDALFKVLGWLLRGIGQALLYWGRRTRQDPWVGLVYLLTWPPTLVLLLQDGRQALAVATAPPYLPPERVWPLGGTPLSWEGLSLVAALLLLVLLFDRRRARGMAQRAAHQVAPTPPLHFTTDEWVLGWGVERLWNPDPGEWQLRRVRELFTLTAEHLRVNLLVVAPQGAGKTSMILNPILRLCRRLGAACLVFDVKGDPEDPGEQPDFDPREFHITFDFAHPARSARLNLAAGGTPRELGEQLGEALIYDPGTDKAYFVNNAKDTLGSLYAAHRAAYDDIPGFRQVLAYLRDPHARADLLADLEKAGFGDASDEILDVRRIDQVQESKNDILGNLDLALAPLARGDVADLLVTDNSGFRIADLLRQGARVRIILPVYKQPRVAPILGRLLLAQFTNAVLDPACNRTLLKVALVDEAHWFVTPSMPAGMAQARANFGSYVLAFQDLPQITDHTLREKIFSVATNKLVMAGVGDYDADKFSRVFGAHERQYVTHSSSQSSSTNTSRTTGRGQHTGGSLAGGMVAAGGSRQMSTARSASVNESRGESRQTRLRADWLPAEIRQMPDRHVLVERRDATGHLTAPTLVALDRALTDPLLVEQDLRLYKEIGRRDASRFQPPAAPGAAAEQVQASPFRQENAGPSQPGPIAQPDIEASEIPEVARGVSVTDSYNPVIPRSVPDPNSLPTGEAEDRRDPTDQATRPRRRDNDTSAGDGARTRPARSPSRPRAQATARQPSGVPASGLASERAPEWVADAARLIVERLPIDPGTAQALVSRAQQNGRDSGYVSDLIEYVLSQPNIVLPAKVFQRLVETNQDRRRPGRRVFAAGGTEQRES